MGAGRRRNRNLRQTGRNRLDDRLLRHCAFQDGRGRIGRQSRTIRSAGRSSYHSDFESVWNAPCRYAVRRPRSVFSCFSILPNLHLPDFLHDLLEIVACWSCIGGNVSKVNHANMIAAMVDSRDFLSARRGAEIEVLIRSHQDRLRRRWTTTITSGSGRRSARRSPSTRTACCCTVARRTAQNASQRAGPNPAARHKSPSSRWSKHAKAAPFRLGWRQSLPGPLR